MARDRDLVWVEGKGTCLPVRCSHPDCEAPAVGSEQRQTPTMPALGFYAYCDTHAPVSGQALFLRYEIEDPGELAEIG